MARIHRDLSEQKDIYSGEELVPFSMGRTAYCCYQPRKEVNIILFYFNSKKSFARTTTFQAKLCPKRLSLESRSPSSCASLSG